MSESQKRIVRNGCVLTPDLFSVYIKYIMREMEEKSGIAIGEHAINKLLYVDNAVLIATVQKDFQHVLHITNKKSKAVGLMLNIKKWLP